MSVIVFILSLIGAEMVSAFGFGQFLIALRVAIPLSKMLGHKYPGRFPEDAIILRALITVIIWVILLGGAAIAITAWGNSSVQYGAAAGAILALVLAFRATGINASTVDDYFKAYGGLIGDELTEQIQEDFSYGRHP